MLSILVPVFNTDVRKLAADLAKQCNFLEAPSEIIMIDDASENSWKNINRPIGTIENVRYLELGKNFGRAAIRNLLARESKFQWLLFLDCDSVIVRQSFLKDYLDQVESSKVLCGGRIYGQSAQNNPDWILHYTYGSAREQKLAKLRNVKPYRSFMTNNFLINREILNEIRFDENISGYGHEDTLFGYRLKKNGVPVFHLDNPVEHGILDSNERFLEKSIQAARNLSAIVSRINEPEFVDDVNLLRFHRKLRRFHVDMLAGSLIRKCKFRLETRLVAGKGTLKELDLLKYEAFICEYGKLNSGN